jgi:endonuclease/exonuclease/phosphatase family metal-dependent hydrolase
MLQPSCEVLLIQEHKVSGAKANELSKCIWPDAACYILDADPGYSYNPDGA